MKFDKINIIFFVVKMARVVRGISRQSSIEHKELGRVVSTSRFLRYIRHTSDILGKIGYMYIQEILRKYNNKVQ